MTRATHSLETERLELKPFAPVDTSELLDVFRDPEVRRYLLDGYEVPREWVEQEISASEERFARASSGEKTAGLWAIRRRGAARILGFTGYRYFYEPPQLQLIYGLLPDAWGQGIATEAARAACEYGLGVLQFSSIEAAIDVPNVDSGRVLERLGMQLVRTTDEGDFGGTSYFSLRRAVAGDEEADHSSG